LLDSVGVVIEECKGYFDDFEAGFEERGLFIGGID
jgi:hypothetical protein